MLFFSISFLVFFGVFVFKISVRNLVSEFIFDRSKVSFLIFIFLFFQVLSGILFRLYLPHVPDDLMFTEIIQTRGLNTSHGGNLDLLGFLFYSFPISFIVQGNDFLYLVYQKLLVSLSIVFFFIGFSKLLSMGPVRYGSFVAFIAFISFYPSYFVHYNNILRESYELFFFSFFVYFLSCYRFFWAVIFFICLISVRFDSVVYVPFFLLYFLFKSKFLNRSKPDVLISCFLLAYLLFLFSPYCYDFFIQHRINKLEFFSSLGIPRSTLFESFDGHNYLEFYKFYIYSLIQYIFDPISIKVMSGTFFMWLETIFSVSMFLLLFFVICFRKSINRVVLIFLCVILLQSCVEYFIQGGMRHRLIPYLVILLFISNVFVNKKSLYNSI